MIGQLGEEIASGRLARIPYAPDVIARFGNRVVGGRVPGEGYVRGVGLEHGMGPAGLTQQIDAHPLFQEAIRAATGRTVMTSDRLRNLFLIVLNHLHTLESQDIIEFGSYRGGSIAFFGVLLKALHPGAKVYGLDTFEGMPPVDKDLDLHSAGQFSDTSRESVRAHLDSFGLDNVELVKGLVEETFPLPGAAMNFGLAHIDLDLYSPIKYIQGAVWDQMAKGGYIVYDDATVATCIGATQAVEELIQSRKAHCEQIFPHFVFRYGLDAPATV